MAAAPQNPNQAIDVMGPITTAHVVLMIVLAALALAAIWYGALLSRRRRAARDQVDADFETAQAHDATHAPSADTTAGNRTPTLSADVPAGETAAAPAPAATMPAPAGIASDLAQIKGLGPKLRVVLAELGITRVAQVAALSPAEAAELDAKLGTFQGRIMRDRWVEQARLLNAGDRAGYEAVFGKLEP